MTLELLQFIRDNDKHSDISTKSYKS